MNKLQRLERIEEEARLLRAEIEAEQAKEAEWPKVGDEVFIIAGDGELGWRKYAGDEYDKRILIQGNIVRTKTEAQRIANYRKDPVAQAREKLAAFAYEYNGGECAANGYQFMVADGNLVFRQRLCWYASPVFKNPDAEQAAIDALGEDLIKTACGCIPV